MTDNKLRNFELRLHIVVFLPEPSGQILPTFFVLTEVNLTTVINYKTSTQVKFVRLRSKKDPDQSKELLCSFSRHL